MASGQATTTRPNKRHVCRPPRREPQDPLGLLWTCPDCLSVFHHRPVQSRELGRVVNLWVRRCEPGHRVRTPLRTRRAD